MAADLFEAHPDAPVAAAENAAPDAAASISVATPAVPDETTPGLEKPRSSFTPWKHNQGFETTSPWCRLLTESPQIFQQLPYDHIIKTPPDVQTYIGKLVHVERRAGDASAVAGASILASLSNLRQDLSRLKPTSQASGKDFKGSDLPSSPLLNEDDLDGQEVNSATNLESEAAADDGTANKSLPLDVNMETGGLEEERHWIKDPIPTPLSVMCSRGSAFREGLLAAILDGRHLEVTFDNFPYYLRFEKIRTAKENILNSVAGVSPDGKYLSAIKDPYQVQKSNLEGLLQKHVEMAAEIKNLDTDLQMLMYENYNKFISATDTIKKMKNNIVGMETNMEQLLEKITSVQSRSDRVNTSLFEKREHIEKLHRTHKLLRKVQFIYDLPTILQKCVKSEAYAEAVKFYTGVTPIFKAYGDSSFLDCKRASEEAVSIIIKNLQTWHFSFS